MCAWHGLHRPARFGRFRRRIRAIAFSYATSIAPACAQQAITALRVIMGEDGKRWRPSPPLGTTRAENPMDACACIRAAGSEAERDFFGDDMYAGTSLGQQKLRQLKDNSNYFRQRLREMGLQASLCNAKRSLCNAKRAGTCGL